MKRNLLALIILTCFGVQLANAQAFTLRLAGGYAWPGFISTQSIMGPNIDPAHPDVDGLSPMANRTDTLNGKPASYKEVKGSYGKGMNFTLGLGYKINKYIGLELGISYLKSATISSSETRQLTIFTGLGYSYIPAYLTAGITSKAYGISLSPAIVLQAPIKDSKIIPYARIGISLPVVGGLTDHVTIDQNSGIPTLVKAPYFLGKHTEVTLTTEGTVSLGVNGAIGAIYNVLPYLSIFAEINGQYLETRAKTSKITQWDADGVSLIANRGVYRTQFNFVDQLDGNSNNTDYNAKTDKTKPKDDVRPIGPFSNLGLNIGVTFNLSKQTLKKKEKPADEAK